MIFAGLFIDSVIFSPYIEHVESKMVWNISGGPSVSYQPNILSELSFNDINEFGKGIKFGYLKKINPGLAFVIDANLTTSFIRSGTSQDSDYIENDRYGEFSRSHAKIGGDDNRHIEGNLGIKFRWLGKPKHYGQFLVGSRIDEISYRMTKGTIAIPVEERGQSYLEDLNSTYETELSSVSLSFSTEHVFRFGTLGMGYSQFYSKMDSVADWNLREDLRHPDSFIQTGDGAGQSVNLSYSYQIERNWDFNVTLSKTTIDIDDGYDHTYLENGEAYVTTLNMLKYSRRSLKMGITFNI